MRQVRGTLITALPLLLLLPRLYLEKQFKVHEVNYNEDQQNVLASDCPDLVLGWRADLRRTLSFTTPPCTLL